ncbi:GntR family transcriptional regulator [Okibacterium endophyticum]
MRRGSREIASDLVRRITSGEFPFGATLPSESQLAQSYGVARGTIRRALDSLARQGVVAAQPGTGWAILSQLPHQSFTELRSFAQWAEAQRLPVGGIVIRSRRRKPTPGEARRLRAAPFDSVLEVTRLRTLADQPVMLERSTYAPHLVERIESLDEGLPSVTRAMEERFGVATEHADYVIDVVAASSLDAEQLGVRRSSGLLRMRRTSFDTGGRPIESSDDRYAPGVMAFHVSSSRERHRVRRMPAGPADGQVSSPVQG